MRDRRYKAFFFFFDFPSCDKSVKISQMYAFENRVTVGFHFYQEMQKLKKQILSNDTAEHSI